MLQRLLTTEEVSYVSSLSATQLKAKIQGALEEHSLRLSGKFTSDNEFTAHDRLVVIGWNMPGLKRKSAYAKGRVKDSQPGALLQLSVNPNAILPLFAIAAVVSGLGLAGLAPFYPELEGFGTVAGIGLLVVGVLYYAASILLRNRLRNKLVKHLQLRKV